MKKVSSVLALVASVAGLAGVLRELRSARTRSDRLMQANALANLLVVITGAALAVRGLRKDSDQ
ncbi:hypothetical protein GCM10012275_04320 [Longimycelium tulufanense]|uniref:Uncharacterized protein n=1 Tax=Longimycelium tulufanense TaxID=907463 RepID=A0A8J3FSJ6_9PSEU|nr:hypothetical protein [Longimycelium tulufanense]GGM36226.1 hypothetical protein GCM10012275_04320 [Longimycelium tulufanense]